MTLQGAVHATMLLSARPSPLLFHPLRARPAPRRPCRVAAPVLAQAQVR